MAWFNVIRNARVGRARYVKGEVVDLDPATLAGKEDNFAACDAPTDVKPTGKKKSAPKAEEKVVEAKKAVEVKAPEVKEYAPKVTDPLVK